MATLHKLGLPFNFISLIALLYSSPTAHLRVNGSLSTTIPITRGTRQGCPLSPLLFIIAMDPLVHHLQDKHLFRGLQFPHGPLLISLYVDDILLFVRWPRENGTPLISEPSRFGTVSGLKINWEKSVLFPITDLAVAEGNDCLLKVEKDTTKYLGVHLHRDKQQMIQLNYGPVMEQLTLQVSRWIHLPLSMAGRIALIKMKVLPRFLYLFCTIPIPLFHTFFSQLRSLLTRLVWADCRPRVSWDTLTLPYHRGGLAVPDFHLYFLVAQAQYSHHWFHPDIQILYTITDKELAAPTLLASLLPKGKPLDPRDIQALSTTCWAWQKLNCKLGAGPLYSPVLPLFDNPLLPLTTEKQVQSTLAKLNLSTLGSLFPNGQARKLSELTQMPDLTYMDKLILTRLQGALKSAFSSFPAPYADFTPLTLLISNAGRSHLITKLYRICLSLKSPRDRGVRQQWEADLGQPLIDKEWSFCLDPIQRVSPNHRHKLLHFKFIHRTYITPLHIFKFDPSKSPNRPKCGSPDADFAHMAWACLRILPLWTEVFHTLTDILEAPLLPSPRLGLLGLVSKAKRSCRRFVAIALLLAKKEVAINWGARSKPQRAAWLRNLAYCNLQTKIFSSLQPPSS